MSRSSQEASDILEASINGDVERIKKLISLGVDLEAKDNNENTPMSLAAAHGHSAIVKELRSSGANLESKNRFGNTPFMLATIYGFFETAEVLANLGSDVNASNKNGGSVLTWAATYGHSDFIEKLSVWGANLESRDNFGKTPLMLASMSGSVEVVEVLKECGVFLEDGDPNGDTALALASGYGRNDVVRKLVELGADLESRNINSNTPLMAAAQFGPAETIEIIKELGTNLNATNNQGHTALALAAGNGRKESVAKLISLNADLEVKDKKGRSALINASEYGYPEIVLLLREAKTKSRMNLESKDDDVVDQVDILFIIGSEDIAESLRVANSVSMAEPATPGDSSYYYQRLCNGAQMTHQTLSMEEYEQKKISGTIPKTKLCIAYGHGGKDGSIGSSYLEYLSTNFENIVLVGCHIRSSIKKLHIDPETRKGMLAAFGNAKHPSLIADGTQMIIDTITQIAVGKGKENTLNNDVLSEAIQTVAKRSILSSHLSFHYLNQDGQRVDVNKRYGRLGKFTLDQAQESLEAEGPINLILKDIFFEKKEVGIERIIKGLRKFQEDSESIDEATMDGLVDKLRDSLKVKFSDENILKFMKEEREIAVESASSAEFSAYKNDLFFHMIHRHNAEEVRAMLRNDNTLLKGSKYNYPPIYLAAKEGQEDIVEILIDEFNANVNEEGFKKMTPLHLACAKNNKNIAELLAKKFKANVNAVLEDGVTPLYITIKKNHNDLSQFLVSELGADVNHSDPEGRTLIHVAASRGDTEVVKYLVTEFGADINQNDKDGNTPLQVAVNSENNQTAQYLKSLEIEQAQNKILLRHIENDNLEEAIESIEKGVDLECTTKEGHTAMMLATILRYGSIVDLLIEKKANLDATDKNGYNALMHAIESSNKILAMTLIQAGTDLSHENNEKFTALMLAEDMGQKNIALILKEKIESKAVAKAEIEIKKSAMNVPDEDSKREDSEASKIPNQAVTVKSAKILQDQDHRGLSN